MNQPYEEPKLSLVNRNRKRTVEPANEASILYDEGGSVAEGTRTALMPDSIRVSIQEVEAELRKRE